MNNDRVIRIAEGNSRKSLTWITSNITLSAFYEKLREPKKSNETLEQYLSMPKKQQDDLKDCAGGFVGGALKDVRRLSNNVIFRDIITLDYDALPSGSTKVFIDKVNSLNINYCIYSTRKHQESAPRLRVLIPLDREVTPYEYEPIARRVAAYIGLNGIDPTTFELARLFYYPTCCSNSDYVYTYADKPFISADSVLATYTDWHNIQEWPTVAGKINYKKLADKQGNPCEKNGIIGAFCRCYNIFDAIESFIPDSYTPCSNLQNRYTYCNGSTTGGAVIYGEGLFLYSHHATDPCCNKLVNAFDLIRLHKFSNLDADSKPDTPVIKLPSYKAMCEFAENDDKVKSLIITEDFANIVNSADTSINEEAGKTLVAAKGKQLSIEIVDTALTTYGIEARNNKITGRIEINGLPSSYSDENAANTLPLFLVDKLKSLGIKGANKNSITDYLTVIVDKNRYNPVCDMLKATQWDGKTRLPELYEVLGVPANSFHAVLINKWLVQCVAMAHNTISKQNSAEGVLTLQGAQGIGKTAFFKILSLNPQWFVEGASIDLKNKDSVMNATSGWICELGELDSTLQRDQSSLKAFITAATDRYRAPYAREQVNRARVTSFCATVNPTQFLRDSSGDRRFWVIPVSNIDLNKLFSLKKEWIKQLWAECYTQWKMLPNSYRLTKEDRIQLDKANSIYRELKASEEELRQLMQFDLPFDKWEEYTASELKDWYYASLSKYTTKQIGAALAKLERETKGIESRVLHGVKRYKLPIQRMKNIHSELLHPNTPPEVYAG